ncbi:MAG TPA: metallophosphoesterase [Vicinamibacterales bacterium]|nr:metallophosphoesterase [Vicinamibacterales bacterium]
MKVHVALLLCLCWTLCVSSCSDRRNASPAPEVILGSDKPPFLLKPGSLKFAVIGDSGRWSREQRETAAQLTARHEEFPFDFVLMLGDNNYGDGSPDSYRIRFEDPYKTLLDARVTFHAALGNHDVGPQWNYPLFNMGGQRYYTFERSSGVLPPLVGDRVRFFAADTVNLDGDQLIWLDRHLSASTADWKMVFMHHPLYSSGRYAFSSSVLRRTLEQTLIEHQVDVVFAGHEHLYERMNPQSGVMYFVNGAAGSVRTGDLQPSPYQAKGYDGDLSFMLVEIAGNTMYFQAINRAGATVDSGKIVKRKSSS